MSKRLKITFVLPFIEKTGGVLVVFEHARELMKMGHIVQIVYPLVPYDDLFFAVPKWKRPYSRFRYALKVWRRRQNPAPWFTHTPNLHLVPAIQGAFLSKADCVIATAWPTAYSVATLPALKGRKFYFIQHYETWTGNIPAIDKTFSLGLGLLTIAPWLTELMEKKFGQSVTAEIHNGIDLELFSPPTEKPRKEISILMMYHTAPYKGIGDGLAVLEKVANKFPEVKIRLFGQYAPEDAAKKYEFHLNPSPKKLVELYQSSHIFFSPSLTEGWHLPPMEAMACGCAVVVTNVGCVPVLNDGKNMVTADPGDVDGLFRGIERLLLDPQLRHDTATLGHATICRYTWPLMSKEFESALLKGSDKFDAESMISVRPPQAIL